MPELSEERRRQIRAEEEAKLRAEQQAEERYREEIRGELRASSEEAEGEPEAEARPAPAPRAATPEARPAPVTPAPTRPRSARRGMAALLVLGGAVCIGLALHQGFTLPFTGPPAPITLRAETSGPPVVLTRATAPEVRPRPRTERASATSSPTAPARPAVARAALPDGSVSIEVPDGWFAPEQDFKEVLEIRWRNPRSSADGEPTAYALLQREDLTPGETLEGFARRSAQQTASSMPPGQSVAIHRQVLLSDFHGIPAAMIEMTVPGTWAHWVREYYWIGGGRGYILTCSASASVSTDFVPAFDRMVASIRLAAEAR